MPKEGEESYACTHFRHNGVVIGKMSRPSDAMTSGTVPDVVGEGTSPELVDNFYAAVAIHHDASGRESSVSLDGANTARIEHLNGNTLASKTSFQRELTET